MNWSFIGNYSNLINLINHKRTTKQIDKIYILIKRKFIKNKENKTFV